MTKPRDAGGEKLNPEFIMYGNKDGQIEFGHLHLENDNLESAVTAGVYLQAYDSRHYLSMDIDGHRKGWTLNRTPATHQILCGTDTKDDEPGFFLLSENGDIIIRAPRGRVRISGLDVDIRADGEDNTRGSINIDSNQSVNIKTGTLDVIATVGSRIFTPNTLDLVANTTLNFVSNFVNGLSAGSSYKPNKLEPTSTEKFKTISGYV